MYLLTGNSLILRITVLNKCMIIEMIFWFMGPTVGRYLLTVAV